MGQISEGVKKVLRETEAILPEIAAASQFGETNRRVRDDIIEKLKQTGAIGMSKPRRYGGLGANARELLEVSTLIGRADAGTAWVIMLTNGSGWKNAHLPYETQDEIWGGEDPCPVVTGVLMPSAVAKKVDGGYRLSGKAHYNSGSWWTDWAGIGFPIRDEKGEIVNVGLALLPREDYEIEDTWFIVGMRSSASNTIVAEDVFVPDRRILMLREAADGVYPNPDVLNEPVNRAAFDPLLTIVLVGPSLGAAESALKYVQEKAPTKAVSQTVFAKQSESTAIQLQVAEAAQLIEVARLLTFDVTDRIDNWALEGIQPDATERARVRANAGFIAKCLQDAIDILLRTHGSGAYAEANPLQRWWRDIHVGTSHALLTTAVGYEAYGKKLLGDPTPVIPML